MSLIFLSAAVAIFVASMVLFYQWLLADRRGNSAQFKKKRWICMWVGLALSAAFLLLFVQTDSLT
jgi:hypothetical protein